VQCCSSACPDSPLCPAPATPAGAPYLVHYVRGHGCDLVHHPELVAGMLRNLTATDTLIINMVSRHARDEESVRQGLGVQGCKEACGDRGGVPHMHTAAIQADAAHLCCLLYRCRASIV
jgi:hypothetical protein